MKVDIPNGANFRLDLSGEELKFLQKSLRDSRYAMGILARCTVKEKKSKLEKLSNATMNKMFGTNGNCVIAYNFDAAQWNRDMFFGKKIPYQLKDAKIARQAKEKLNKLLAPDFELVAIATMPVEVSFDYMGAFAVKKPIADSNSSFVVGNILCRDLNTNKIVPVSDSWIVVADFSKKSDALNGPGYFVAQINSDDGFIRNRVLKNFLLSRQK